MDPDRSHHLRVRTPAGRLEDALRAIVPSVLRELAGAPQVEAIFFARYQWELLLFVLGEPAWIAGDARPLLAALLDAARGAGLVEGLLEIPYRPEYERYGGETGMRLAERIFHVDSLCCLALIEAEARGEAGRSRRELSLVLTERWLELCGFDHALRIAFYRQGYAWALEQGRWAEQDLRLLEARFRELRGGLAELAAAEDLVDACGGQEPARIIGRWLAAMRPLVAELLATQAAGRIAQQLVPFSWSCAHMQCNRLGIAGDAEAILRFFMHRLHQGAGGEPA